MRKTLTIMTLALTTLATQAQAEGIHQELKQKFIEGDAGFMSLVALALVIGLAFCIERIIYLSLSEINAKQLMSDVSDKVAEGDVEGAKRLCQESRGPVAAICYQGAGTQRRETGRRGAHHRGIWHRGGGQPGKRLQLDNALHRHGSLTGLPGHGNRHGDGL